MQTEYPATGKKSGAHKDLESMPPLDNNKLEATLGEYFCFYFLDCNVTYVLEVQLICSAAVAILNALMMMPQLSATYLGLSGPS